MMEHIITMTALSPEQVKALTVEVTDYWGKDSRGNYGHDVKFIGNVEAKCLYSKDSKGKLCVKVEIDPTDLEWVLAELVKGVK